MSTLSTEVVHGDLTKEKSDAILNIINADLDMGNAGELSREISRVCGPQVKGGVQTKTPTARTVIGNH